MKFPYIVFISVFFISNCSLVGLGAGAYIDSENKKKTEDITSQDKKIKLEFVDKKRVKARYRGMSYSDRYYYGNIETLDNGRLMDNMGTFPAFGEEIVVFFDSDTLKDMRGKFTGIIKRNGNYELIISPADSGQAQSIPIVAVTKVKRENGNYMNPMPEPEQIHLLYEKDKKTYIAPLNSLIHINRQKTNSKLWLYLLGLTADTIYFVVQLNSIKFDGLNFKESFEAY